uniref:Uncharacterized protein n=1 Tax=Salmo trutta TaxID=8032 RepID=A0A673YUW0_SALTR
MSRNYIFKYDEMRKGDYMWSNNKEWKACFQEDGNCDLWLEANVELRHHLPKRCPPPVQCSFVMYKREDKAMWHTKTQANVFKMCRMWLRNDGNLGMEKDGEMVWNSAQNRGSK